MKYEKEIVNQWGNPRLAYIILPPENPNPPQHPKGHCQMCGIKIEWPKRKWCSEVCQKRHYDEYQPHKVWWPQFRAKIIKERGRVCEECNEITRNPQAHHIIPVSKGGEFFDEENIILLCAECHKAKHHIRALEPTSNSHQTILEVR